MSGNRCASLWGWVRPWLGLAPGLVLAFLLLGGCQNKEGKEGGGPGSDLGGSPALKQQSANNLQQLGIAMHNYNDTYRKMPPATWIDRSVWGQYGISAPLDQERLAQLQAHLPKDKKLPCLSWRVALLPYVEQVPLYQMFHLNEPWDSPHNLTLLEKMPRIYAPVWGNAKPGMTYYQVFVGKDAPFNGMIAPSIPTSFGDGMSTTFLIVEGGEPVPWTKPEDLPYDANKPLPKLGGLFSDGFNAVFADGAPRFIPKSTPEKTIRALITPNGHEAVELP